MPRHPPATRLKVLAASAARDGNALPELLRLTTQQRLELARRALRGRAVDPMISAEDVTQEVAERILVGISAYDPERGTFLRWVAGITRNVVSRQSRPRHRMVHAPADQFRQPHQVSFVALRQTLTSPRLSSNELRLMALVAVGSTVAEVAKALQIGHEAASKRIQRARARLD